MHATSLFYFLLLMEASGDRNVVIARDVGIKF